MQTFGKNIYEQKFWKLESNISLLNILIIEGINFPRKFEMESIFTIGIPSLITFLHARIDNLPVDSTDIVERGNSIQC